MADRRAEYRFKNGTVWDRLLFSIMENCIIGGWTQSLTNAANYRVFPGGLKIQYGRVNVQTASNKNLDYYLTLPIAITGDTDKAYVAGSLANETDPWQAAQINTHAKIVSKTQLRFVNVSGLNPSAWYELRWLLLSY